MGQLYQRHQQWFGWEFGNGLRLRRQRQYELRHKSAWQQQQRKLWGELGVELGNEWWHKLRVELRKQQWHKLRVELGNEWWHKLRVELGSEQWHKLRVELGSEQWHKLRVELGKRGVRWGELPGGSLPNGKPR